MRILTIGILLLFSLKKDIDVVTHAEPTSVKYVNGNLTIDFGVISRNNNLPILRKKLSENKLVPLSSVRQIPGFVKDLISELSGQKFTMADPGQSWQCCDSNFDDTLPLRSLIYAGRNDRFVMLTYLTGGVGEETHIVIIEHNNQKIKNLWLCTTSMKLNTQTSIVKYLYTIKNHINTIYIKNHVDI